jgi:hypothetical protein
MKKLPEGVKTKWVEALRSGEYKQGVAWLRDEDNRFCCMGVLADVLGCKWVKKSKNCFELESSSAAMINSGDLPEEVFAVLTSKTDDHKVHVFHFLVEMNDLQRKSFTEIADWIDNNL